MSLVTYTDPEMVYDPKIAYPLVVTVNDGDVYRNLAAS